MQARHFMDLRFVLEQGGDLTVEAARTVAETVVAPVVRRQTERATEQARLVVEPFLNSLGYRIGYIAEWTWQD